MCCIFLQKDQWATLAKINPRAIDRIAEIEQEFGHTLKRNAGIWEIVALGDSLYQDDMAPKVIEALGDFDGAVTTENWTLPAGAFGSGGGSP